MFSFHATKTLHLSLSLVSRSFSTLSVCVALSLKEAERGGIEKEQRDHLCLSIKGEKRSGIVNERKYHLSYSFCVFVFPNSVCLRGRKTRDPKGATERTSLCSPLCLCVYACLHGLACHRSWKKRDVIKKEQKEKIVSLSIYYVSLSFSTLFVCPCVRHRSWKKKSRDGEKEQKTRSLPLGKTVNKLQEPPPLLLTYLNQTKTTQETKQNGHPLLLTSKYRENTQERKQNKIGT
jgi:hypothetical protein